MEQAIVNIILDKRTVKFNGKFPVKLIVYHNHKNKRYGFAQKIDLTEDQWVKINAQRLKSEELIPVREYIESERSKAQKVVKQLGEDFSYETFEALFFGRKSLKSVSKHNVYALFDEHIKTLLDRKSMGAAESYKTAKKSLQTFAPDLMLKEVTPQFLEKYEHYMIETGKSVTTVGIYLRSLRTILNLARDKKLMTSDQYPFGQKSKKRYEIPIGRNIKKALSAEDIRKIRDAKGLSNEAEFARDMWMFSFYCNGMNMTDICHLRRADLQDGFIYYFRSKTIRTQRVKRPIEVFISQPAQEIINKWGTKQTFVDDYVFSVLNKKMTSEEAFWAAKNLTRSVNHYMCVLGGQLEITCKLTTYVARHSYATLLKYMGTSIEEISESLGHSNVSTTKSYLDSFPKEHKKETANKLANLI